MGNSDLSEYVQLDACLHSCCLTRTLGVPHRLIQDDVYEGKVIPKGSWVSENTVDAGLRC